MTTSQRAKMVKYAVLLLREGTLTSNLAGELMKQFGLTPAQARQIAQDALREFRKE